MSDKKEKPPVGEEGQKSLVPAPEEKGAESGNMARLKEQIGNLAARLDLEKKEVAAKERRTKSELVTEIADGIMGHKKMASSRFERQGPHGVKLGYGYAEIEKKVWAELAKEWRDLSDETEELGALEPEVAKLEVAGADPGEIEALKAEIVRCAAGLEQKRVSLQEKEKEASNAQRADVGRQEEQAESVKDVGRFILRTVLAAHKEFEGADYSGMADELLKDALVEVGRRTQEAERQARYGEDEKKLDATTEKLQAQEGKLEEAEAVLGAARLKLAKGYEKQGIALDNLPLDEIVQLLRERGEKERNKSRFFRKGRQERVTAIDTTLTEIKQRVSGLFDYAAAAEEAKELDWKYVENDNYKNDSNVRHIQFYDTDVPAGHPRSAELKRTYTDVVRRTKEVIEGIKFLRRLTEQRDTDIGAKLKRIFDQQY